MLSLETDKQVTLNNPFVLLRTGMSYCESFHFLSCLQWPLQVQQSETENVSTIECDERCQKTIPDFFLNFC